MSAIEEEISLDNSATRVYSQLKNNRDLLMSRGVIPREFQEEFTNTIYPEHNLKWYARLVTQGLKYDSEMIKDFVFEHMHLSLSINCFGRRLRIHRVNLVEVLSTMLPGLWF